jgi:hypothetical protein
MGFLPGRPPGYRLAQRARRAAVAGTAWTQRIFLDTETDP